jgi:hypothetical protein
MLINNQLAPPLNVGAAVIGGTIDVAVVGKFCFVFLFHFSFFVHSPCCC